MSSDSSEVAQAPNTDEFEEKICQLQKEKADLERDFGLKRAQFQDIFVQQEEVLNKEREKCVATEMRLEAMGEELSNMQSEMDKLHWELESMRTAASLSEASKQEEIDCIVSHYQQEVVGLQQLLKEAEETANVNPTAQYESERNKLVSLNVNYEEQIQELRNRLSQEKDSFLSAVAKSIKRVGIIASANTSKEPTENLEDSMKKAQEEAQILKSVVMPLENEIKTLKARLEETEAKLVDALKRSGPRQGSIESRVYDYASQKSPSLPDLDSITDLNEKVERLFSYLKSEKAARKDLEMYVAVLSTQKSMLQDEADKVNNELQDVCRLLEEEKHSHEALKQTWQMANDQYLESQRLLMMDMRRMEGVLTTEQQRQIADIRRKASNDVPVKFFTVLEHPEETDLPLRRQMSMPDFAHVRKLRQKDDARETLERRVKELEEKRKVHEQEQDAKQKLRQGKIGRSKRSREGSPASGLSTFRAIQIGGSIQSVKDGTYSKSSSISSSGARGAYHSASSSDVGDDFTREETDDDSIFIDFGLQETQSLSDADGILQPHIEEGKESNDSMTVVRISPEKVLNLPPLTAAQMKAITDPTPESEAHKSLLAGIKSKCGASKLSLEGKRLVSEAEWTLLEDEMRAAREKLGQPCSMCTNYEAQLQTAQEELQSAKMLVKRLERSLNAEKETNRYLQQGHDELQLALKNAAEDAQMHITDLTSRLQLCEECVTNFREHMSVTHLQLQDHCKSLTESREEVQRELTKLQEENDSLVSKYSKTAQQLQNEDINLPNNLEEMELLLLKYREEIISAKVAKEHTEETLKSELVLLKSQVLGEQQEKESLKVTLNQEIAALEAKLAEMHTLQQELEQEVETRTQSETKLREAESAVKNMQIRSKQLLGKLQERLEEMDKRKSKLESDNHVLKGKVHALQADLRNSEAVQRDFVKLSQSLQVQLEKIRQAENEVRWQHEDDIDECNNCKVPFTVTRRKHHCRHCGQIFCSDCTSKSVPSGSSLRPSKVCDVCHTILVKDATPYFSTEAPVT